MKGHPNWFRKFLSSKKDDLTRMAVYQYTQNRIDRNTYLDEYMDYEGFKRKINGMSRLQVRIEINFKKNKKSLFKLYLGLNSRILP